MLIVAVGVGVLIGLTMGALGGGGSILTVPALVTWLASIPAPPLPVRWSSWG